MAKATKEGAKDSGELREGILALGKALAAYEPGNAIALLDIVELCQKLSSSLGSGGSPGQQKAGELLQGLITSLPLREGEALPRLQSLEDTLGVDDPGAAAAALDAWNEEAGRWLASAAEGGPAAGSPSPKADQAEAHYGEHYFDAVIEDQKLLRQFYNEAAEHLEEAQSVLIEVEYDPTNQELLNTIFRNFHTIKGSSAFLGLKNIEELSHSIEDLLAIVREGSIVITQELINIVFSGIEVLRTILDSMAVNEFAMASMVASFRLINIYTYIRLMRKIIAEYKYKKIGEILEDEGKISAKDLGYLINKQKESDKRLGELAVDERIVTNDDLIAAIKKQKEQSAKLKKIGFVKVANEKLNTLIDIVGELVINQSMLKQELVGLRSGERIDRSISQLESITTTIKNLVLSMGMVPISEIFNKLRVVARNTAGELGKSVFVEMHGEDTELDRNVIETIYDPLMHILRNAIDHGIEDPAERARVGKDRIGKITMHADHKGSGIEITITDDGKGIQAPDVLKKALKMKLLKEDEAEKLGERDMFNLLFLPGFSTAEEITKISGRGVGLDVVKKNVESIHGRVDIASEKGKYTRFTIRLPLSLAIIEGFVTRIGENKYIFPFTSIEEIKVFREEEFIYTEGGNDVITYYRGQHIPVIFAHDVLRELRPESVREAGEAQYLALLFALEQSKYCVIVDEIIGKQEIVIKNLSGVLEESRRYLSGGTIFGDGSIGFVVDMQGFIDSLQ